MNQKKHAEILNLNAYRKQRKRSLLFRRTLLLALLLLLICAGYGGYQYFSSSGLLQSEEFPIRLNGDKIYQTESSSSNLALLTEKSLSFYAPTGANLRTLSHTYVNPVIQTAGDFTLLYDIGQKQFSLESSRTTHYSALSEQNIFLGAVAKNGVFALVTQDNRYQAAVTVYSKSGKQLYKWYSAESTVTSLAFDETAHQLVAAGMNTRDGSSLSVVYGLNVQNTKETFRTEVPSSMPIGVSYLHNRIHLACSEKLAALDLNGQLIREYNYPQKLAQLDLSSRQYTVLLFEGDQSNHSCLVTLDPNGDTVAQRDLTSTVRSMTTDGKHIALLSNEQIDCYRMDLAPSASYPNRGISVAFLAIQGSVGYDCSTSSLNTFRVD